MRSTLRLLATLMAMLLIASPALADEGETETESTHPHAAIVDLVSYWFDAPEGLLYLALLSPDDEPISCEPEEPTGDGEPPAPAGEDVATEDEGPTCEAIDITRDGEYNHGSMVSSVVHELKARRDALNGPFGQYVRIFAHLDLDDLDDASVTDVDGDEGNGEDDKVKGNNGNGGNGGPPDHAPAHGPRNR